MPNQIISIKLYGWDKTLPSVKIDQLEAQPKVTLDTANKVLVIELEDLAINFKANHDILLTVQ
jgi:hypothetical protein